MQKTLGTIEKIRLVNAAHRFARISQGNPVRLFGLLYMLDIRFFREAGRSCTGEVYYAMADGPAPGTLRPLLVMRGMDLNVAIGVLTSTRAEGPWPFDPSAYCPRALGILDDLEGRHGGAASHDLSLGDANAWWRVYTQSKGIGAPIPYEMTLSRAEGIRAGLSKGFGVDSPPVLQTYQAMGAW